MCSINSLCVYTMKMLQKKNRKNSHPHSGWKILYMEIMLSGLLNFIKFQIHAHFVYGFEIVINLIKKKESTLFMSNSFILER